MIENVIFDLDGTLVDSVEGIEFSLKGAINLVFPVSKININNIKSRMGPPIEQITKDLIPQISKKDIIKITHQFRLIYDSVGWKKTRLFDSAKDTLKVLARKRISIFVATNKPKKPTGKILKLTRVERFLTDSISPDSNGKISRTKRDLMFFLINKYRLRPNNTLMVGDSIEDAQSAHLCALDFAFAAYGYGVKYPNIMNI